MDDDDDDGRCQCTINRSWIHFQPQAGTIWNLLKLAEDDLDSLSLAKDDSNWEIRRTRIKTHLSKLGSVLFAIQRLPDDLLLEIFGYCIKEGVAFQAGSVLVGGDCLLDALNGGPNMTWIQAQLKSLRITKRGWGTDMDNEMFRIYNRLLSCAPNIHTFRGGSSSIPLLRKSIHDLTYNIQGMPMVNVQRLLAPCVNLEKLFLKEDAGYLNYRNASTPVYLSSLLSIEIYGRRSKEVHAPFPTGTKIAFCASWLQTPALKVLTLDYSSFTKPSDSVEYALFQEIDDFISRSACFLSLRSLTLLLRRGA
ncbi:hypothetical protein BT96DRAFT_1098220 [Gymnopus androsaceus JB14]|uniref:Uncharacterized protein n=1 Tax=Gymnopus androsaceus JB14 TaxID=1447944 RepID=A0A6A4HRD5_9AGAR|nr:hypothetical protein BT96DRAFT_1098220 [Gymnopus androsaceus JB14]